MPNAQAASGVDRFQAAFGIDANAGDASGGIVLFEGYVLREDTMILIWLCIQTSWKTIARCFSEGQKLGAKVRKRTPGSRDSVVHKQFALLFKLLIPG